MSLKSGKHTCRVAAPINGWFCESKTGTAGLRLPLEITGGECNGTHVEYIAWLSHAALDRSVKTLADVFGWDGNLAALASLVDSGPFVGRESEITVEDEEYNGKMYPKIKWLNKAGGGSSAKPLAKDAVAEMVAKLNATAMKLASEPKEDAPKAAPKSAPKPPKDADLDVAPDDIPFAIPFAPFIAGLGAAASLFA